MIFSASHFFWRAFAMIFSASRFFWRAVRHHNVWRNTGYYFVNDGDFEFHFRHGVCKYNECLVTVEFLVFIYECETV